MIRETRVLISYLLPLSDDDMYVTKVLGLLVIFCLTMALLAYLKVI